MNDSNSWVDLKWWSSDSWEYIKMALDHGTEGQDFLPYRKDLYRALILTPPDRVKAIILGQDPYPTPGYAHGLSFSVPKDVLPTQFPPSLKNIFTELTDDLGYSRPKSGDLTKWARQGVLMWNTYLTVCPGSPMSHRDWGWSELTKEVLQSAWSINPEVVFVVWGNEALKTIDDLNLPSPNVIFSSHPSPMSANKTFFGSRPFSRTNDILVSYQKQPVDWNLDA